MLNVFTHDEGIMLLFDTTDPNKKFKYMLDPMAALSLGRHLVEIGTRQSESGVPSPSRYATLGQSYERLDSKG